MTSIIIAVGIIIASISMINQSPLSQLVFVITLSVCYGSWRLWQWVYDNIYWPWRMTRWQKQLKIILKIRWGFMTEKERKEEAEFFAAWQKNWHKAGISCKDLLASQKAIAMALPTPEEWRDVKNQCNKKS